MDFSKIYGNNIYVPYLVMNIIEEFKNMAKKFERSFDRILFLAGMVLAFIGFMIPTFHTTDEGFKNIFGAAVYFNYPGYAYISTFIVAMWLCSIAGIALFFITRTLVGDIVVCLLAIGFGIAALVSFPIYFGEDCTLAFLFSFFVPGYYLVIVGFIVSIVASVLGAMHIQNPSAK